MAQPTQPTTPLDWRTKIVNPDGTPNNYFIRLWQTVYGNGNNASQDIVTLKEEVAALEAATLQEGTGIAITPDGKLLDDPTIALADTAVTPGTYGDATHVGQFTVDQQGRLTAASSVAISGGGGGGGGSGAWACPASRLNWGGTLSTTFATGGVCFRADYAVTITSIFGAMQASSLSNRYQVFVAQVNTPTLTSDGLSILGNNSVTPTTILGASAVFGPPVTSLWYNKIELTSPATLTAGNYYLLGFTRTDATNTTTTQWEWLPTSGFPIQLGFPSFCYIKLLYWASNTPAGIVGVSNPSFDGGSAAGAVVFPSGH